MLSTSEINAELARRPALPEDTKPLSLKERRFLLGRCDLHDSGHNTGLSDRAVLAIRSYEASLRQIEAIASGVMVAWARSRPPVDPNQPQCTECGHTEPGHGPADGSPCYVCVGEERPTPCPGFQAPLAAVVDAPLSARSGTRSE